MDRRASIAAIFQGKNRKGKRNETGSIHNTSSFAPPILTAGLDPYTGPFDRRAAAHLLRRATFGPTYDEIRLAESEGLAATLDKIFSSTPIEGPPLNPGFADDPHTPIGETWINHPSFPDPEVWGYKQRSLFAWTSQQMLRKGISIQEKLVLFWHNHFATGDIDDPKFVYRYSSTLTLNPHVSISSPQK